MFSRTVSDALLYLATVSEHKKDFADTYPTQKMSLEINDFFDILNGRHPREASGDVTGQIKKRYFLAKKISFIFT